MATDKEIEAAARAIVNIACSRGEYETPASEWNVDDFKIHRIWEDAEAALAAAEQVRVSDVQTNYGTDPTWPRRNLNSLSD